MGLIQLFELPNSKHKSKLYRMYNKKRETERVKCMFYGMFMSANNCHLCINKHILREIYMHITNIHIKHVISSHKHD